MADWLTLDELATYLKRGHSTLYRMARLGQIPASKIGREWRFDRDAIDAWLRRQRPMRLPSEKAGKPGKVRRTKR